MRRKVPWWRTFRSPAALVAVLAAAFAAISGSYAVARPQATAGGNAADAWRQVFPLLKPRTPEHAAGLLSKDEWNTFNSLDRDDITEAEREQLGVLIAKLQPALALISEAAAQRRCDFQLDRSAGFELALPHLTPMRQGATLLRMQGSLQLQDGDIQGFVDTQGQLARVAVQPGQDEILIGGLVGNAIASAGTSSIRSALDEGIVSQQAAKDLIEALAPVRATDPFHYGDTPVREFEALEATLRKAATRRHGWHGFLASLGVPADQIERGGLAGPRELLDSLPSIRPLYDLYGQALREVDPAKARALLAKADALAAGLNPPADTFRLLLPSFERVLDVRDRFNLDLASLMKKLEAIAADPAAASRLTAPAVLWARVAARVCALPDETQAAVEALRSGTPDLPTADRDRAVACLNGCDATIFEAMRMAAACERKDLDFSKVRGIDAWPPLPTFGGLRGATRLAVLRARMLETDRALELIDLALAAVAALASDPSQAASSTSAAIAKELVPAIGDMARRPDMDEARRARLDTSIARIDRRDAFGFRASLSAERSVVSARLRSLDDDSERFDRDLRRRNAEWIMAARIELGLVHAPIERPGALESIDDLFPAERLLRAQASSDAITELLQGRAQGEAEKRDAPKGRNPLATLPIEPIRDPATDATEAQATLSAIDAALKPTALPR
jgi:hypothetical protein